ncbi:MAG: D-Ala-D-Ala carboxypeptidase family metallohydrolase [candidate division WOR-3 bacterium]
MNWELVKKYFKPEEFKCPCCGKCDMLPEFILKLYKAREISNVPFIINSGFRCRKHNTQIRGAFNSYHLKGEACDIKCEDPYTRYQIIMGAIKADIYGIIIYKNFIHLDNRKERLLLIKLF